MKISKVHIILIIIVLTPLWSYLWWNYSPVRPMNMIIADKTVSTFNRPEHRSFNWIQTHERYVSRQNRFYQNDTDYYGFFPLSNKNFHIQDLDSLSESQIDSMSLKNDMVIFADMYGVYYNEWYLEKFETEHSRKIYGGMSHNDLVLLKKLKDQGKLIVGEFNMLAHPTPSNIRFEAEKLLDIKWTGWTARYFDLLDTIKNPELPRWVIRLYKEQHNNEWPFKRSGIVFVHEDERIFILENGTHLKMEVPFIFTGNYGQEHFGLPYKIHYPYWIDITFSGATNKVLADYKIKPNQIGDSILKHYGVPKEFPALIEHLGGYRFYYFCGDFSDNPINLTSAKFKGIEYLSFMFYSTIEYNQRTKFFWKYYRPLMKTILDDYYLSVKVNK